MSQPQSVVVRALAAVAGVVAAFGGARPTGTPAVDIAIVIAAAAAVTWSSATAPWWAVASACAIATAFSSSVIWIAVGAVGALAALAIGAQRRNVPWVRAVAAGLGIQAFAHLGSIRFLGLSAIIACLSLLILFILGIRRRPSAIRRNTYLCLAGAGALVAFAAIGLLFAALSARAPLTEANLQAHAGLDALNRGDIPGAAKAFGQAKQAFRDSSDDLSAWWAQPGRLLPVVAQNRTAAVDLADQGAGAMGVAEVALDKVNPDALRVNGGQINLDAVRALVTPFTDLNKAIADVQSTIASIDSPWLVAPLQDRLRSLTHDLVKNKTRAENALLAVRLAPDMLGGNGLRRYFIAFTTPAEARGGGGFLGNYAEITIDNGKIANTAFGRPTDLASAGPERKHVTLTGPKEFLDRWGRFVMGPDGYVDPTAWSEVTVAPDFPLTAQVISDLYPQSGGQHLDGVFSMDPQTLAAIVSITGPLAIDGLSTPLTADNTSDFIVRGQYNITENNQRIELLDLIAKTAVQKLLSSSLPRPAELAALFGPLARNGHLQAWSAAPAEEKLFGRVGMSGSFPPLDGNDGVALTFDNNGGSKIDAYLRVSADYHVVVDADGHATGALSVTLENTAPAAGLPAYVIGNLQNLPSGTNKMFFSAYTALPVVGATIDEIPMPVELNTALGWNAASAYVDIPPGGKRTVVLNLAGELPSSGYKFVTRSQPLAESLTFTLSARCLASNTMAVPCASR